MSTYTTRRCLDRAEANRNDGHNWVRVINEHETAALSSDPEEARIARGFAMIARRKRSHERWLADTYERLANGEDVTDGG